MAPLRPTSRPDAVRRRLLVSIHDVTPATLVSVQAVFARLKSAGLIPATLLIVPDTGWDESSLHDLRALLADGAEPAGHGWRHRAQCVRGLQHRLHSLLISRDVAEHLALDTAGAVALMQNCYAWFVEHGLPAPELYVPPAWAMGNVPRSTLDGLPFTQFETMTGVYDRRAGRFRALPLVGYETDTFLRASTTRASNAINRWLAGQRKPLRLSIHPRDFELRLASDLAAMLDAGGEALSYRELGRA